MRLNKQWAGLSAVLLVLVSCAPAVQDATRRADKSDIKKIAVAPFFFTSERIATKITPDKRANFADLFYAEIAGLPISFVSPEISRAEYERIKSDSAGVGEFEATLEIAKKLNADFILAGNISEYREREGGEFGITSPASVDFGVQLLNLATGEIVWEAYYSETQRPLLENVAKIGKFIKRRARWVTREELAKEGISEIAGKLGDFLRANAAAN